MTAPTVRLARLAMATRFELLIADAGDASLLRAAGEEALDEISSCEQLLSVHRDDGGLFQLNHHAAQRPHRVDARICDFITQAQSIATLTDGTCDIAVGPLLQLWHIHRQQSAEGSPSPQPTDAAIAAARALIDVRRQVLVDHETLTVSYAQPGVRLDPGALGKGWAIKRAMTILQEHGIQHALLHGGTSSIYALGQAPGQDTWDIRINVPERDDGLALARLAQLGLSVSALHGRRLVSGDYTHGHIIDPRSGYPVAQHALCAVTHADSVIAEAWSTALLIDSSLLHRADPRVDPHTAASSPAANQPKSYLLATTTNPPQLMCHGPDFTPLT